MKAFGKQVDNHSWWVIVLKVIAYAIGLVIGGIGTTATAQMVGLY